MKTNVTYIISNIDKALAFEWVATHLNKNKFNLNFILLNHGSSELENYLKQNNIPVKKIKYSGKKNIPKAIFLTCKYLKKFKTNVVHTHLFDASIIGLIAARLSGVPIRIHTRHHADYHHTYYPKAVKWDKICNALATDIIAISENVQNILVLQENVPKKKISKIYHGFDIKSFTQIEIDKITNLKNKYNIEGKYPVIGVISRFIKLKGVQYIIPAFKNVLKKYPNALLLLFNTKGDYEHALNLMLNDLPENSFKKVPFENDITSLYHIFDLFVHVPINEHIEAFGQTYIECLASETPLIATKSGIGAEILLDEKNSLLVPYENSEAIYQAIIRIVENNQLKNYLISNSLTTVKEKFSLETMIEKLERLYLR